MSKRTDSPKTESKTPVTVNILSNIEITLDGKSILTLFVAAFILFPFITLVASGSESETLFNLIRSLIEALMGS